MSPLILFSLVLMLTFGVIAWVLRPTKTESDIQRHLKTIGSKYTVDPSGMNILKQETLSSISWLDRFLAEAPGALKLRRLIMQAGKNWTVGSVVFGSLLAFFVVTWLGSMVMPAFVFAFVLGLVVSILPFGYLHLKRDIRFRRCDSLLPETIDLMSRALQAGHGVTAAIEMASQEIAEPVASEFRTVFEEQNLGLPLREALLNLAERLPLDDVRFLVTAILVQKETGGNLAEILERTAVLLRERMRLKGQLRIYTAQGRLTGWFLCLLPFILFFLISIVNPGYEKMLWTNPLGRHLVYAGLIMLGIGIYSIRKIVEVKV
jgi:tight adherence protein B